MTLVMQMVGKSFDNLYLYLFLSLLEFRLLLLDPDDKHLSHLVFSLLQLLLVVVTLRLKRLLEADGLVLCVHVRESHL